MTRNDLVGMLLFFAIVLLIFGLNVVLDRGPSCVPRPGAVKGLFLPDCQ